MCLIAKHLVADLHNCATAENRMLNKRIVEQCVPNVQLFMAELNLRY